MAKKNEKYLIVILSTLIMVFSIHIGSSLLKKVQVDATDENIFTLSEGTKSILAKLNGPMRLKLYYSKTAANKGSDGIRIFNNYFQYISDLLEQYVALSNNNLSLEIIDPRPDTRDEEDAIAYGLKKFNLTETETYFFGLVIENSSGSEKIIEFLAPAYIDRVEYDITKLIYSATNPKKPRVGILSSLEIVTDDVSPYMAQILRFQGKPVKQSWQIVKNMKEFYDVIEIEEDTMEITGVDILMVIHPRDFEEKTLFAIDQFVMKGGKLMVFVDPMTLVAQNIEKENKAVDIRSDLSLLKKWGIGYNKDEFAGDKKIAGSARFNPLLPPQRAIPIIVCNTICYENYNDVISSTLGTTSFLFAGAFTDLKVEGIEFSPFVSTTDKGNVFKANERELQNMERLWSSFTEGEAPLHLAVKTIGKFQTNFPEGITVEISEDDEVEDSEKSQDEENKKTSKTKKGKVEKKKLEAIQESLEPGVVVAFADVDFISDPYAFRPSGNTMAPNNDNSVLVLNALETLTGSTDLLGVRSKPRVDRRFSVIRDIELEAEKKTEDKVKEINDRIRDVQKELNSLGKQANEKNIALIQNEGLKKRKDLSKQIAILKRELRDVKREGREKIENLGMVLQTINTTLIPFIILIFGIVINLRRKRSV